MLPKNLPKYRGYRLFSTERLVGLFVLHFLFLDVVRKSS